MEILARLGEVLYILSWIVGVAILLLAWAVETWLVAIMGIGIILIGPCIQYILAGY